MKRITTIKTPGLCGIIHFVFIMPDGNLQNVQPILKNFHDEKGALITYPAFVDTLQHFMESTLDSYGVIGPKKIMAAISEMMEYHPDLAIELWVYGLALRNGYNQFAGMSSDGKKIAFNQALDEDKEIANSLILAGMMSAVDVAIVGVSGELREITIFDESFLERIKK